MDRGITPPTIFSLASWFLASTLMNSKMGTISKKFATLAATAVFVSPFLPQTLNKKNYPELYHLQGGIKFAIQISPLLNINYLTSKPKNMFLQMGRQNFRVSSSFKNVTKSPIVKKLM